MLFRIYCFKASIQESDGCTSFFSNLSLLSLLAPNFTDIFFRDINPGHSCHFPYRNKFVVIESSVYKCGSEFRSLYIETSQMHYE